MEVFINLKYGVYMYTQIAKGGHKTGNVICRRGATLANSGDRKLFSKGKEWG